MKKLLSVLLTMMIMLSGCSSQKKYVGTWNSYASECYLLEDENPDPVLANMASCTIRFNSDGSGVFTLSNGPDEWNGNYYFTYDKDMKQSNGQYLHYDVKGFDGIRMDVQVESRGARYFVFVRNEDASVIEVEVRDFSFDFVFLCEKQ